jgi:SAM-dependent methyltransferase
MLPRLPVWSPVDIGNMEALKKLRRLAGSVRTRIWRKLGWVGGSWEEGVPGEMRFWESALKDPAQNWSEEAFRFRTDPEALLQKEIQDLFPNHQGTLRILDVGAGPLSSMGKRFPGRQVELVAVDPLAQQYDRLLDELNLVPPVRTVFGEAERLESAFGPATFDLACASNALDHCRDVLKAITEMLQVVKPGGFIYLWHFANEGHTERYAGLHQWNFDARDGDFTVSDGRTKTSLRSHIGRRAELWVATDRAYGKKVVIATMRKAA